MKPNDVYAMPDLDTEPFWYAPSSLLEEAFGAREWDIDEEAARKADDQRIQCHLKMRYSFGEDHSSSVTAVTLEGKPFGIFIKAGHEGRYTQFIPTDAELFKEATRIIDGWRRRPSFDKVADPAAELENLTFFHETAAIRTEEGFRLIDLRFVDNVGTVIFDEARFLQAFRDFDKVLREIPHDVQMGIDWMKEHKAEIISKAVPEHLRSVTVNAIKENHDFLNLWVATVVATDEGTYAIGIHEDFVTSSGFASGDTIHTERLGGPELFEQYAERYGAEASAPTP